MQNSDLCTSIQVSIGTRPHLSFCGYKPAWLAPELLVSMGSSPHLWFCACKRATLGLELQVSVGPRPHMWILHAKQRLLDQNNKSLWYQTWPVVLCMYKSVLSIRITSLYGSQHSSVVFACKTETFGTELQVSIGPRPHLSFCACKTAWLASELLVSMGPSSNLWFSFSKQRIMDKNY